MGSQSSEESEDIEIDLKEQRRLKRLDQLALARQKAAEVKKRRSAPKKELKALEQQVKERLYQEDVKRVARLKEQASDRLQEDVEPRAKCSAKKCLAPPISNYSQSLSPPQDPQLAHLDDLIKILYS